MYGSTLRILRSGLIAYTVGGSDVQPGELGIIDLVSKTKTVKYVFDTLLGTGLIRFYDKSKGKIITLGGWGMAGSGAPCGINGNVYVIDENGNVEVKCMPLTNTSGNVGWCFADSKTGYIYCGQSNGATGIYRLNMDGSYNDRWSSNTAGGGSYTKLFIPLDEDNVVYASVGNGATQYFGKGTTSYLFDSWKSTTYVENGLTQLATPSIEVVGWDAVVVNKEYYKTFNKNLYVTQDFTSFTSVLSNIGVIIGKYLNRIIVFNNVSKQINIVNPVEKTVEETITIADADFINQDRCADLPYFIVVNTASRTFKVKALAYNDQIPMIEFSPTDNKIRVIDILTGNTLSGFKVKVFYSRFIYPISLEPMRDPDHVLTPSDWTGLPNPPDSTRVNANLYLTL
jgi:hypothetical protein